MRNDTFYFYYDSNVKKGYSSTFIMVSNPYRVRDVTTTEVEWWVIYKTKQNININYTLPPTKVMSVKTFEIFLIVP